MRLKPHRLDLRRYYYRAAEVCLHPFYIGLIGFSAPSMITVEPSITTAETLDDYHGAIDHYRGAIDHYHGAIDHYRGAIDHYRAVYG